MSRHQSDSSRKRESTLSISNKRILRQGIFYTGDRGTEKPKGEKWGNPEIDNNQERLPPLLERQVRRLRNWGQELMSLVGSWIREGLSCGSWNHQGDAAASGGATRTEREGKKLPSFTPPPTTHLHPVAPLSQSQLTWEPGKLRLQGI